MLVNTPGALGGTGATTNLAPALTLGCGSVGGSATSDNITPLNLINIRRVAYGVKELEDLRREAGQEVSGCTPCCNTNTAECGSSSGMSAQDIERLAREVLASILNK